VSRSIFCRSDLHVCNAGPRYVPGRDRRGLIYPSILSYHCVTGHVQSNPLAGARKRFRADHPMRMAILWCSAPSKLQKHMEPAIHPLFEYAQPRASTPNGSRLLTTRTHEGLSKGLMVHPIAGLQDSQAPYACSRP